MTIRVGILTISDRSFRNERPDLSGPALASVVKENGWDLITTEVVPDELDLIKKILSNWADGGCIDLVLSTGGTGFSPRDITPEATIAVIHRNAPGISEAMRWESLRKTPHAMLSRGVSGMRKKTLIVNLPGSPKAAVENLQVILSVIPHAIELLQESSSGEAGHQRVIGGDSNPVII